MKSADENLPEEPTFARAAVLWTLTSAFSGYLFIAGLLHVLESWRLCRAGLGGTEVLIGLPVGVLVAGLGTAHPFQKWSGMRGGWLVALRVIDWALVVSLIYVVFSGIQKAFLPAVALLGLTILTHFKTEGRPSESGFEKHSIAVLWAFTSMFSGYLFIAGLLHALESWRLCRAGLGGTEILIGLFLGVLVAGFGIAHPFQRWSGMRGGWLVALRVIDWALVMFLIYAVLSGIPKAFLPAVALLALTILTHFKTVGRYSESGLEKHSAEVVVFVHGFRGHYKKTWGRFPDLLESDLDLPDLGVLLWGYRTTGFPWDPPLQRVANRLETDLRLRVPGHARLYLVGHSMGGLVILKSLVDAMQAGHANEPVVAQVALISLFASPCNGSTEAALLSYFRSWRFFFSPQLRELARGSFTDSLLAEVNQRLYKPTMKPGDENSKRAIVLRANVAEDDGIVSETSARGVFSDPRPFVLPGDHSTVKMPKDHDDVRYKALKKDIEDGLGEAFRELCLGCLSGDEAPGKERQLQFERLYGRCITGKLRVARPTLGTDQIAEEQEKLTRLVWVLGGQRARRPGEVVDTALAILFRPRKRGS